MKFAGVAGYNAPTQSTITASSCNKQPEAALLIDVANASELSLDNLDDRIEELGHARSQIEGMLAEALAERARRSTARKAVSVLRERVLEAAGKASADVKLAVSLSEKFPSTLQALADGKINSGHARVIERVAGKPNYHQEAIILEDAKAVPSDLLSRYALRHTPIEDPDRSKYKQQHQDRRASITQEPDGSWKLFAHLDYIDGRRASMALTQMAKTFKSQEKPNSNTTYLQRNADALMQLITREGPQRAIPTSLLMIAEYNDETGQVSQPRLDDGQPVPSEILDKLLKNAEVYTAFANAQGQPLWLGKSQRSATSAQRIVLAARDGGCVGCGSPSEQCEAHHIQHWQNNGPTDISNLVQLCPGCHHLIHECNWQIHPTFRQTYRINAPPIVSSNPP